MAAFPTRFTKEELTALDNPTGKTSLITEYIVSTLMYSVDISYLNQSYIVVFCNVHMAWI